MITPSGRKVTWQKKERKKNNAVNSGHLVPRQRTQATETNCGTNPRGIWFSGKTIQSSAKRECHGYFWFLEILGFKILLKIDPLNVLNVRIMDTK